MPAARRPAPSLWDAQNPTYAFPEGFKPTWRMTRYAQACCDPAVPAGDESRCKAADTTLRRLRLWRAKPDFGQWLRAEIFRLRHEHTEELWNVILKAAREGDIPAATLYLERYDRAPTHPAAAHPDGPRTFLDVALLAEQARTDPYDDPADTTASADESGPASSDTRNSQPLPPQQDTSDAPSSPQPPTNTPQTPTDIRQTPTDTPQTPTDIPQPTTATPQPPPCHGAAAGEAGPHPLATAKPPRRRRFPPDCWDNKFLAGVPM